MPLKIVRNDITKMRTEAIVNTANEQPTVGPGCDRAVYQAAGYDQLLQWRKEHVGPVPEGDVFLTPGFKLPVKYIIHAVSPLYMDGKHREDELLRECYRKSLQLADEKGIRSVAFPLIATGGFGYPKEEGMRIAVDEINAFLLNSDLLVYLVVFDEKATQMGRSLYPDLEAYIDRNYVQKKHWEEYGDRSDYPRAARSAPSGAAPGGAVPGRVLPGGAAAPSGQDLFRRRERPAPSGAAAPSGQDSFRRRAHSAPGAGAAPGVAPQAAGAAPPASRPMSDGDKRGQNALARWKERRQKEVLSEEAVPLATDADLPLEDMAIEEMESKLAERMSHMKDTFTQYLLYLISQKGMDNAEVYKRAIVDKKVFSKIKNNPDYHPKKMTALCLCIGAKLNLDESKDLLARAGYALSPCDKTDIIFSYFIEHGIYDMIELDIQLEEHGLPCIIS